MKKQIEIKVEWLDDNDPDLSYLGEYTSNRPGTCYIDRKTEVLVDPNVEIIKKLDNESEYDELIDELSNFGIEYYEDFEYDEDDNVVNWFVNYSYWEELPYSTTYDRNSYRYVKSFNYTNPEKDEYQYVIADNKLLEDYNRGNWYMRGCSVSAYYKGIKLAENSLWGLDSTMTESDDQEVIDDLTSEVMDEAKKVLEDLKNVELA